MIPVEDKRFRSGMRKASGSSPILRSMEVNFVQEITQNLLLGGGPME